jgi:tRNA wybutosine-synthesizing protein 2
VISGEGTETVHKENGILYKLDVARVMFSSGNMEEKRRMASLDCRGETIADMFAGIGYFSLPLALHAKAERVVACEINPVAFGYLVENIALNRVETVVQPFLGDNRDLPGEHWADRVLMGYVGTTEHFLPKAFELVKSGGVIHYHETCPVEEFPERSLKRIAASAGEARIEVLRQDEVKSYAPAISHYVIDFRVFLRS